MKKTIALLIALALALSIPALAELGDDIELVMDATVNGMSLYALRVYGEETEILLIRCSDGEGDELWSRTVEARASQGCCTDAFPGGTPDAPRLVIYTAGKGLASCDVATGEICWTLPTAQVDLGESIHHALAQDGTMVIGGGFGPDPVAIDMDGNVLWCSDCGSDDIHWLDDIRLDREGVAAHYDHMMGEDGGWVSFNWEGQAVDFKAD